MNDKESVYVTIKFTESKPLKIMKFLLKGIFEVFKGIGLIFTYNSK
jgi:hypothetical protein